MPHEKHDARVSDVRPSDEDRYFDLTALSRYSGLSLRTIRRYMVDADHPLPHHHIRHRGKERGRILISKRAFDAWVSSFGSAEANNPDDAHWVRSLAK